MVAEIEAHIPRLTALCRSHRVARLAIFGSILRNDFDPSRSDVDLLVDFAPIPESEYADNYFNLVDELQSLFETKVDLVFWSNIENPHFKREVESSFRVVYAA